MAVLDHPIFTESIQRIQALLGPTGLPLLEQELLERLIHSSGDPGLAPLLRFTPGACLLATQALAKGSVILTDTEMAAAAVSPMARRTFGNPVECVLQWAPAVVSEGLTRTSIGMDLAIRKHPSAFVLIGSSPTALMSLLSLVDEGLADPVMIVGMPVGFVGVSESKACLVRSGSPHVLLMGSRGGAGLVASVANALLRRSFLDTSLC